MARPIVGNPFENQIPTVAPTARPVDIYERGVLKKSPFEALANTLTNLERKATPIFQAEEKRRAEEEFAQGQELYAKTRKSIGDAVKAGVIEEGASPYLRKGYRIANLNVLSARYASELNEALVARKLYTNGSPEAIEEFTEKFYDDFQQKNGFDGFATTEVADYFLASASKANEAFRESWRTKHLAYQKDQNYLAFQNEVGTYIKSSFLETDTAEARAVKMSFLGKWVTNKSKEAAADGMDMSKVNQNIIDSVVLSAYEMNDESILDVLDNIATGTGILGGTAAARKAKYETATDIATKKQKAEEAQAKALVAQQKQQIGNILQDGIQAAFAARAGTEGAVEAHSDAIVQLGEIGTTEAFAKQTALQKFFDTMTAAGLEERNVDDAAYAFVQTQIRNIDDAAEALDLLTDAMNSDQITPTQSTTLFNLWEKLNKEDPPVKEDFVDTTTGVPAVRDNFLRTITTTPLDEITGADTVLVQRAITQFEDMYVELSAAKKVEKGADLTNYEKRLIAREVVQNLQEIFVDPKAEEGATEITDNIARERKKQELIIKRKTETGGGGTGTVPDFSGSGSD